VVTESLRGVVERGTASYYHDLEAEIGRPAAGKTGTSNEFIDAWFVGFVPQLSTSVWVGYPSERRSMVNINGLEEINGENYPLDIWSLYMQGAAQKFPVQQFDTPSPDLALEVKTDGRTYVKPPPTPEPPKEESTDGEATDGEATDRPADENPDTEEEPGIFDTEDEQPFGEEPSEFPTRQAAPEERRGPARPALESSRAPDRAGGQNGREPASPAPASASPAEPPD